jgi:geranylgeranyl diphosphate/geranylgeranyl-bacteriochlorophyllide a reductase
MKEHGRVFWVLGIMQYFWYSQRQAPRALRQHLQGPDVQQLTFDAYMNKRLVRKKPMAHVRIFFKDMAHLLGLARVCAWVTFAATLNLVVVRLNAPFGG